MLYHVPQQSRREKLRFPPDVSPPNSSSSSSSFLHHHHPNAAMPVYHTTFLPSSSSSSSSTCYYSQNPNYSVGPTTQFIVNSNALHPPTQQISHHSFSLSLSSSSPPPSQLNPVPLGPFTGYAAVLNRSRFLNPARQLLDERCDVARGGGVLREPLQPVDHDMEGWIGCGGAMDGPISGVGEWQWKKTRLISMLDELYRRYKQYYQQVQSVIASFESVAGLTSAAPYASMALKAMSKHFRVLKNAISEQLRHTNKAFDGKEGFSKEDTNSGFGLINTGVCSQRVANNSSAFPVWRPQRGLPEHAVAVLRAWLFEHFLHPYPTDTDKQMLAKQTGLSRNQVSNWFINARVRLWKPMVEEIHSLEMRQLHNKNRNSVDKQAQLPSPSTATSSNYQPPQNAITQKNQNPSTRRPHGELTPPYDIKEPFNFAYSDLSGHGHIGVGEGVDVGLNGGGVSLTLGLHQNNGVCLTEPLPLNVVRRFGLDECNDAYVIGAFDGQDRNFEKEIGGHFARDFVG